jgi:protein TonB
VRATACQWLFAFAASLLIHAAAAALWVRFEPGGPAGASPGWGGGVPNRVEELPRALPEEPLEDLARLPEATAEQGPVAPAMAAARPRDLPETASQALDTASPPETPAVSAAPPGEGSAWGDPAGGGWPGESGAGVGALGLGLWKGGGRDAYWVRIREGIVEKARYPTRARRRGIEGEVLLLVRVDREGRLERAEVLGSSGSQLLDREALESLRRAAPFGAIAISVPDSELEFEIPVEFALE